MLDGSWGLEPPLNEGSHVVMPVAIKKNTFFCALSRHILLSASRTIVSTFSHLITKRGYRSTVVRLHRIRLHDTGRATRPQPCEHLDYSKWRRNAPAVPPPTTTTTTVPPKSPLCARVIQVPTQWDGHGTSRPYLPQRTCSFPPRTPGT